MNFSSASFVCCSHLSSVSFCCSSSWIALSFSAISTSILSSSPSFSRRSPRNFLTESDVLRFASCSCASSSSSRTSLLRASSFRCASSSSLELSSCSSVACASSRRFRKSASSCACCTLISADSRPDAVKYWFSVSQKNMSAVRVTSSSATIFLEKISAALKERSSPIVCVYKDSRRASFLMSICANCVCVSRMSLACRLGAPGLK
mmetsp:Transcript_39759/g.64152  ORF Transcript_39759/g.64152 Transcript_39759/m.64152 type:complete len:206 (+) Transcript_39759:1749-2366(+)